MLLLPGPLRRGQLRQGDPAEIADAAAELERLGYGALWIPGGLGGDVLGEALGQGGTSFDSLYVNVNGESGYFDRSLAVYGREGEP